MGTEVYSSVGVLLSQLQNAKLGLQKIDEHIKRVVQTTGRFQNDRNNDRQFQNTPNDSIRGGSRLGPNRWGFEEDRPGRKRPQETKTVFSRLSTRPAGDSDDNEEEPFQNKKPRVSSQVIRDLPSKQQVLKAQAGDEVSKARNRRMFGSLLGTLQKFKQEEIVLKNKEDKKAQIEKKIEEQAQQERENQKKERQTLFADREMKKATIKALEMKMMRMKEYEKWVEMQKPLVNFVQTRAKPHLYWLPKRVNHQAQEKLDISRKKHEKTMEKKAEDLKTELESIEQRCLRNVKIPAGLKATAASLSESFDEPMTEESFTEAPPREPTPQKPSSERRVTAVRIKNEEEEAQKAKKKAERIVNIKKEGEKANGETSKDTRSHGDGGESSDSSSSSDENEEDNTQDPNDPASDDDSQNGTNEDQETIPIGIVSKVEKEEKNDAETKKVQEETEQADKKEEDPKVTSPYCESEETAQ